MLWRFFANQDKKKKLKNIIGQKRVQIEGMTCEHCKNRVENALNRLEGVSAKVNLKKKTAVVSMEKEVEDMQLQKAVEQAGQSFSGSRPSVRPAC